MVSLMYSCRSMLRGGSGSQIKRRTLLELTALKIKKQQKSLES